MIVEPTPEHRERAAAALRAGTVVAFPTETVYGLGADATNPDAVARIFEIKERPRFDPLIVHVDGLAAVGAVATAIPPALPRLADRFWPGPLTLVLPKRAAIPDLVTAGLPSVAVRVPAHPVALDLLHRVGRPLAAPSANRFGCLSPTTAAHVAEQLGDAVEIVLDGGACRIGVESTIVSLLGERPALWRPGGVPLEELEEILGPLDLPPPAARPLAPGQLARHYAPRTPVIVIGAPGEVPPPARARAALLLPRPAAGTRGFARVEILSGDGDPHAMAAALFAALRRLDAGGCERIYAVAVPERGLGRAIMDRLRRAAAPAVDPLTPAP